MIRQPKITIWGLYNYDPRVMEGFNVPEGVDRQTALDALLMECSELEVLYPSVPLMKMAISTWCRQELPIWQDLQKTKEFEYNPIWNVDGTVKEKETRDLHVHSESNGTNTDQVQGFNSSDWQDRDKTNGETEGESSDTGTVEHETIRSGNIGVTSTQSLINEQREVVQFDMIEYIIRSFKRRFCLQVY